MYKKIILGSILIIFALAVFAGLFCEDYVRKYYPEFTSINFASLIIILIGCLYAFVRRNMIVPVMFFIIACALPWVKYWIVTYWNSVYLPW